MANTPPSALLVLTSWNTASDDLTSQPTRILVKDFCKSTLKSDEVSKLYCTVLDVEVSEDQKRDAESVGATLIPATRDKWSDPEGDPPTPNWLLHHYTYFPGLNELTHTQHVVSFSSKTKNAAAAIHDRLFPHAQLHQLSVPTPPGIVFAFDAWSRDGCGLTGYHRAIIQEFIDRKAKSEEYLKAYSTVVDFDLTGDQINDAKKYGVTLIPAQLVEQLDEDNQLPVSQRLMYHQVLYPKLQKLKNIKYVVGYAPKTGLEAISIKKHSFPNAKLVLINHVCPESNCLFKVKESMQKFENEMLKMASEADILFSIGPKIFQSFEKAYSASYDGKKLSDIPHSEILPKPGQIYMKNKPNIKKSIKANSILTYGQLNTEEALERCKPIAVSIVEWSNYHDRIASNTEPEWKIQGTFEYDAQTKQRYLPDKTQCRNLALKYYSPYSAGELLQSVQQSHLCLPPSCYTDYSFEGLEAMAAGLPTKVLDDCHIASLIKKYFDMHKDCCITNTKNKHLVEKISEVMHNNAEAFEHAKLLQSTLAESEDVAKSFANFSSILEAVQMIGRKDSCKTDPGVLTLHVRLYDKSYQHLLKQFDDQAQTRDVLENKEKLQVAWHAFQEEVHENANTMISTEATWPILTGIVKKHFGEDTLAIKWETGSFKISLNIPTQYNLLKVKHTCKSGSFPDSFEPLLITDKMRGEADTVGLRLKLKATYDQARFDELELFFINRDGGGLKPVQIYDDVIEGRAAEEIHIDDEDTDQKSDTMMTGKVDSISQGQSIESTEQSLVSQRIGKSAEREKLQSELKEEEKLTTKKLDNTVKELEHNVEHSSLKKQAEKAPTLMPQRPPQHHHHEMSAGHMMEASAATGPPTSHVVYSQAHQTPYPTAQSHTQGTIVGQMIPQHIQYQPDIQHTQKPQMYRSTPTQGHLTSPHLQGQNPIPQEIQTSATQVYGDWSVTLVNGQHQGQGRKFKSPPGLTFHRDKLVVCDTSNNIVQILNQDYTCDKVIGSFDGQFAKPFRPRRVAISCFNYYFILDSENKQIVVCDENGEFIQIIALPEKIKEVFDIALMDDFVLVTLSFTSRDVFRSEDRDDRLVKYTQSGEYVTGVRGQTSVQTKGTNFFWPASVVVTSKNVIMVYDRGNRCIKCFDSNLNYLYQFRPRQLQRPRTELGRRGGGHIAVDEDDNIYVCGYVTVRSTGDVIREWILKYGCDGTWICNLFKGNVSKPWYIAVMGDKIGVVEKGRDQIKIFSK